MRREQIGSVRTGGCLLEPILNALRCGIRAATTLPKLHHADSECHFSQSRSPQSITSGSRSCSKGREVRGTKPREEMVRTDSPVARAISRSSSVWVMIKFVIEVIGKQSGNLIAMYDEAVRCFQGVGNEWSHVKKRRMPPDARTEVDWIQKPEVGSVA